MEMNLAKYGEKLPLENIPTFEFDIGGLTFAPNYLQAVAIVGLLFLLVLTLARLRRLFVKWSFGGWQAYFFLGFLLAIILEGFLIISGRTVIIGLLGWKNAPEPIIQALDTGRNKLIDVLGVSDEVCHE